MDRFKREREWTSYIPDKRSKICDEDLLKSSLDTLRYVTLFDSEMKCDIKGDGSKDTSEISSEPIASTFGSMPQQLNPRVSKLQPHPLQVEYKNDGHLYSSIEFKEYTCAEKTKDVVNLGPYLCMPQSEAAKILGLPASTLSKRWKEAVPNRKVCVFYNITKSYLLWYSGLIELC